MKYLCLVFEMTPYYEKSYFDLNKRLHRNSTWTMKNIESWLCKYKQCALEIGPPCENNKISEQCVPFLLDDVIKKIDDKTIKSFPFDKL